MSRLDDPALVRRAAAQEFVDATARLWDSRYELRPVEGSIRVRRSPVVFIPDKA